MVEVLFSVLILSLLTYCFGGVFSFGIAGPFRKKIKNLVLIVCAIVLLSAPGLAEARAWKFAVIGDSRANDHKNKKHPGVNWKVLRKIAEDIKDKKVDLVIFPGDLILGGNRGYKERYADWANAMRPILNAKIPVYPVRGNHEEWGDPKATEWRKFVRSYLPNLVKLKGSPKGEQLCTYSFTHKNALFVGLDEYFGCVGQKCPHKINQAWLNGQLKKNNRKTHPHVFVYAHTPVFKVSGNDKHSCPGSGTTGALYCHKTIRSNLWKSLCNHGVRVYFCGHVHFYTANKIKIFLPHIYQIVNGLGGVTLGSYHGYVDKTHVDTANSVVEAKNIGGHHGYNLVHVDGKKVTIDLMLWRNTLKKWERKDGIYGRSYTVK